MTKRVGVGGVMQIVGGAIVQPFSGFTLESRSLLLPDESMLSF